MSLFTKKNSVELELYVFRFEDGFLFGLAPAKGFSPCRECIFAWAKQKYEFLEIGSPSDIANRPDLILELKKENSPHMIYELTMQGSSELHECLVIPHPSCECYQAPFIKPDRKNWASLNLQFSPFKKIETARVPSPSGNRWLTLLQSDQFYSTGCAQTREESRIKALEQWIRKSLPLLSEHVGNLRAEFGTHFLNDEKMFLSSGLNPNQYLEAVGIGEDSQSAVLNGLHELAKKHTLNRFANTARNPMLIVGAENWVREQLPFYIYQKYDIHLLFYPNSMPSWVVGVIAVSRLNPKEAPIFIFSSGAKIFKVFEELFSKLVLQLPPDGQLETWPRSPRLESDRNVKLNQWWNAWVYRCVKISLKDILHLEDYSNDAQQWKDFFKDGQQEVLLLDGGATVIPSEMLHVKRVRIKLDLQVRKAHIHGIGTLTSLGIS